MMSASMLHSANWYRVSSLHPNLQPGTRIQRQMLGGEEWFIFTNPVTQTHFRLNRKAYELIARFDGKHSVDTLWRGLLRVAGDEAPTQDEVIAVLAQLLESGLILFDNLPEGPMFQAHRAPVKRARRFSNLNPFAFSVRLFDPANLLQALAPLQSVLFHPIFLCLLGAAIGWALIGAALDWSAIHAYATIHLLTPRALLLAWFAYPVMKALHELGHGLTVRHFGGNVGEVGVSFFMLLPSPYVDASAATAFPGKWQRAAVSSAGIVVELFLAACAFAIWSIAADGVLRDTALAVMAIGGVSTLVFNGNPLLRMDGYHILCDVFELPNLGVRSPQWWLDSLQYWINGTKRNRVLQARPRETPWLVLYAPASLCYRVVVSLAMIEWLGTKSSLIALLALGWVGFAILGKPLWKLVAILRQPLHPGVHRWQRSAGTLAVLGLIALFLFVPLPTNTLASGVVWLPDQSQLRASSDSQVTAVLARHGEHVKRGQPLIVLDAPQLEAERKRLAAQIAHAETDQANGWLTASQDGRDAFEKLTRLNGDMTALTERLDQLTLKAGTDGTFVLPHPEESIGTYLAKGSVIAYVIPDENTTVRALVTQDDIGRIKSGIIKVSVMLAEDGSLHRDAQVLQIEPAATNRLPSKALGDTGGAALVTDQLDKEGLTLLEPVFVVDVRIPQRKIAYAGARATVRFEHEARPLAQTAAWRIKQLFLKLFAEEQ